MAWPWIVLIASLWIVVLGLSVLVLGLSQRLQRVESTLVGAHFAPDPMASAPPIGTKLEVPAGYEQQILGVTSSQGKLLVFLSSTCSPCLRIFDEMRARADAGGLGLDEDLDLIIVTDPDGATLFEPLSDRARLVTQSGGDLSQSLGVAATPFGLAMDPGAVVRGRLVPNAFADLERLASSLHPESLRIIPPGDPVYAGD